MFAGFKTTGVIRVIFYDEQDIWKDAIENDLQSVTEMPYFEGDFWPNILEESIKEEQEEMEKRRREEEEAAADTDDGESSVSGDRVEVCHIIFSTAACY